MSARRRPAEELRPGQIYARRPANAAFIGFTGTPIDLGDRNTQNVFGDYLDVYDIQRSVADGATVPIYYEPRHARLRLDERYVPHIDPEFEEVTEGQEEATKELLKTKWGQLARIVGERDRLRLVAEDIVAHYEARDKALPGKAMIVCMTREICVNLYDELVRLRPAWANADDDKGQLKVVMTGSASDAAGWQQHIRNNPRRKALADRFRDPASDFKLVIVRDMWLTGFDAPSLHTMYVDKPMKGHTLMQAIARVNRVYPDKEGGLVVAYLPLQTQLAEALNAYSAGDRELAGRLQDEAAAIMKQKHELDRAHNHGFANAAFFRDDPAARLTILAQALNHILAGATRSATATSTPSPLRPRHALAIPHPDALAIRDEVGFFQAVAAALKKTITTPAARNGRSRQTSSARSKPSSTAPSPLTMVDILPSPASAPRHLPALRRILLEVQAISQKNVDRRAARCLIEDEIAPSAAATDHRLLLRRHARQVVGRYNHMELEAKEIIDQLIELAREMREAQHRGEQLGFISTTSLPSTTPSKSTTAPSPLTATTPSKRSPRSLSARCAPTSPSTGP